MEEIELRLQAQLGQLRALNSVLVAVIRTLPQLAAAQAAVALAQDVFALPDDDAPEAEQQAFERIGHSYLDLLSALSK